MGSLEEFGFCKLGGDNLEAKGEVVFCDARGDGNGREACKVGWDGEKILEIFIKGVGDGANFPGWGGSGGHDDEIKFGKSLVKILLDEGSDLGCFLIKGIIKSRREGVSANHDSPFDFISKAFGSVFDVKI